MPTDDEVRRMDAQAKGQRSPGASRPGAVGVSSMDPNRRTSQVTGAVLEPIEPELVYATSQGLSSQQSVNSSSNRSITQHSVNSSSNQSVSGHARRDPAMRKGARNTGTRTPGAVSEISRGSAASSVQRTMVHRIDSVTSTSTPMPPMPSELARRHDVRVQPLQTALPRVETTQKSTPDGSDALSDVAGNVAPGTPGRPTTDPNPGAFSVRTGAPNRATDSARRWNMMSWASRLLSTRQTNDTATSSPQNHAHPGAVPPNHEIPSEYRAPSQQPSAGSAMVNSSSTPDIETAEKEANSSNKKYFLCGIGLLVVVGVVVGIVLALSGGGGGDESSDLGSSPSSAPQGLDSSEQGQLALQIKDLQTQLGGYSRDPTVFGDLSSPQSKALLWLTEEDSFQTDSWDTQPQDLASRYALVVFYYSLTNNDEEAWLDSLNFLTPTTSVCSWQTADGQGVECDSNGQVIRLRITRYNRLEGDFPQELEALAPTLTHLEVSHQSDPTSSVNIQQVRQIGNLASLSNLAVLDLSHNQIFGGLPESFSELTELKELYLNNNRFRGEIPISYENLQRVEILHLQTNDLFGPADNGIYNMIVLKEVRLDDNIGLSLQNFFFVNSPFLETLVLDGVTPPSADNNGIPSLLSFLASVQSISWNSSGLSGRIPPSLLQLPKLLKVSLAGNAMTGPIPWESFRLGIQELDLSNNEHTGTLPTDLTLLKDQMGLLTELKLGNNQLTGPIPASWGALADLEVLDLYNNELTGSLSPDIFVENADVLQLLQLQGNVDLVGSLENFCTVALNSVETSPIPDVEIIFNVDCAQVDCSCCGNCQ